MTWLLVILGVLAAVGVFAIVIVLEVRAIVRRVDDESEEE